MLSCVIRLKISIIIVIRNYHCIHSIIRGCVSGLFLIFNFYFVLFNLQNALFISAKKVKTGQE